MNSDSKRCKEHGVLLQTCAGWKHYRNNEVANLQARLSAAEEENRQMREQVGPVATHNRELLNRLAAAETELVWHVECRETARKLKRAEAVVKAIRRAHEEHLKTGDYAPLGMAAQGALLAFENNYKPLKKGK